MEFYLGQINIFGFNFPPRDCAFCSGQLMSIQQYNALYALLSTTYGGDGRSTFGLPNLIGRSPLHFGTDTTTGQTYDLGSKGGKSVTPVATTTAFTLSVNNLPAHTHAATLAITGMPTYSAQTTLDATTNGPGTASPSAGATLSASGGGTGSANIYLTPTATTNLVPLGNVSTSITSSGTVAGTVTNANTGSGAPVNAPLNFNVPTVSPYLALNFCIALNGIFPTRN